MIPFWEDDHLQLWGGDCREVLRELPAESVHCVVTSPPYWGLRDYGTASWEGGDEAHNHLERQQRRNTEANPGSGSGAGGRTSLRDGAPPRECTCGARRIDSQLGLEATPEEFVASMVAVFREVRRVLRRDGTLWLNLGDSYAANWSSRRPEGGGGLKEDKGRARITKPPPGLKSKDLVGIPWRVAFALQADGWYLRSDIIRSKPNPMPESVTDRPTKAHEYLFLLTRSPRYYYDAEAVREDSLRAGDIPGGDNGRGVGVYGVAPHAPFNGPVPAGRNLRSVRNIATEPYPGAHFATFPRKLVEPCVKAGTSERGVCPECGAPWVRVVLVSPLEATGMGSQHKYAWHPRVGANGTLGANSAPNERETTGWRPSCSCFDYGLTLDHPLPVPAVVLDPFAGSGTTLLVAQALGRRGVGIDLSPDYLKQALERNRQTPLGLVG